MQPKFVQRTIEPPHRVREWPATLRRSRRLQRCLRGDGCVGDAARSTYDARRYMAGRPDGGAGYMPGGVNRRARDMPGGRDRPFWAMAGAAIARPRATVTEKMFPMIVIPFRGSKWNVSERPSPDSVPLMADLHETSS